ncbi:hypothetical protein CAPTEDRAFT_204788 [Capitella teleta]|uniref:HTH CENPB-type domain-containing protein n=1 Tax=Capitella teleta TaxID=283909 RepID=R7UPU2_CAPTE|nr:hypothetical protein CAPTEDRAFT_204788 [Capitella teleta]|eukprot:ELU08534.1 hypothetical protein CAPTEDRAFT_204788 [Capitella teleta]
MGCFGSNRVHSRDERSEWVKATTGSMREILRADGKMMEEFGMEISKKSQQEKWKCGGDMNAKNVMFNNDMVMLKAIEKGDALGVTNFKCSKRWLHLFNIHKRIKRQLLEKEARNVDPCAVDEG